MGGDASVQQDKEHAVLSLEKETACGTSEGANVTVLSEDPQTVRISGQYFTNAEGEFGYVGVDVKETGFNTLMVIVSTDAPEESSVLGNLSACAPQDSPAEWMNHYNTTIRTNAGTIRVYHDGRPATVAQLSPEE